MTITSFTRPAVAMLAAAALTAPVAAEAKPSPDHGAGRSSSDAHPGAGRHEAERNPGKARHQGRRNPTVTYIFKGTVVSVDGAAGTAVVKVATVNHQRRSGRNLGVTFDLRTAKIAVADTNADAAATTADIAAGDRVLVHARLPLRSPDLTAAVVARRLVDQTHPVPGPDGSTDAPAAG